MRRRRLSGRTVVSFPWYRRVRNDFMCKHDTEDKHDTLVALVKSGG